MSLQQQNSKESYSSQQSSGLKQENSKGQSQSQNENNSSVSGLNNEVKIQDFNEEQFMGQDAFLTDFKNSDLVKDMDPQVVELADQLNGLVNQLESKIDLVIEKHEGEFLIAYKNHMQKIRRELLEMKRKTDEQERNFQAKDRISALEKQLAWFREEASKLYNKLEQKNKETDQLKMRMQDLEKEKNFLEGQVKSLMKKNKYMNVKLNSQILEQQSVIENSNTHFYQQQQQQSKTRQSNNNRQIFDNINSLNITSQQQIRPLDSLDNNNQYNSNIENYKQQEYLNQIEKQIEKIKSLVHFSQSDIQAQQIVDIFVYNIQQNGYLETQTCAKEVINCFKKLEEDKNKIIKRFKDKAENTLKEKIKLNNTRSDLETFFLECVETVRRQIMKRKQPQENINQFLNQIKDYNIFRVEDKQKILELMVQHEKILLYIYQKIFPTQFSLHIKNVLEQEKNQIPQINDENQENKSQISNQQQIYQNQQDIENYQNRPSTYLGSLYKKPSNRALSSQNKKYRQIRNSNMSFDNNNISQNNNNNNMNNSNNLNNNTNLNQYNNILQQNNIKLPNTTQSKYRSNSQYNSNNLIHQNFGYQKITQNNSKQTKSIQSSNYVNNEGLINNNRKRGFSGKIKVQQGKLILK